MAIRAGPGTATCTCKSSGKLPPSPPHSHQPHGAARAARSRPNSCRGTQTWQAARGQPAALRRSPWRRTAWPASSRRATPTGTAAWTRCAPRRPAATAVDRQRQLTRRPACSVAEGLKLVLHCMHALCGPGAAQWPPSAHSMSTEGAHLPSLARSCSTAPAAAHPPHSALRPCSAQAEVAWLIKSVNPEVPLGEAALGLIVEEVGAAAWPGCDGMGGPAVALGMLALGVTAAGWCHRCRASAAASLACQRRCAWVQRRLLLPLSPGVGRVPGTREGAGPDV